jgi:starvation-inducible DNA-binding protein
MDESLIKAAQTAFASTFAFYLKAHNFHWNVEDESFPEFHAFFGGIYDEVYGTVDTFAEKIRTLGAKIPGSLIGFKYLSVVEDQTGYPNKDAMLAELLVDNDKLIAVLNAAYDESEKAKKRGFNNYIAERLDAHAKHGWMLRATLPDTD